MKKEKAHSPILDQLHELYPKTKHYLNFKNPLELLTATILSAQVRDEVVNAAAPAIFSKFKTARDYAKAPTAELEKLTSRIPFFRNKSKNIKEACRILDEKYGGAVPRTIEELVELPGIGRKTANAILTNAFGIVEGVVVDTHVIRLSQRMGLTKEKNPEKIEKDLMQTAPKKYWPLIPHWMKELGRSHCRAPKALCAECPVKVLCPKIGV